MSAMAAVSQAHAQLGGLGGMMGGNKGGGGASVDSIIADFMILAKSSAICMCQLGYAFDTRQKAAEWQARAKSTQAMSKPDEIGAAMTDVSKSSDATIQSLNDSNKAAEAFNKLSPEMQKFVIAALATAGIGALKIVEIVKKVQSAKPTPMELPKIATLKDPIDVIGKSMPVIWDKGVAMLKNAKVTPPTPDKDAKMEASADGWPPAPAA
jgi:hypothetical protein